MATTVIGIWNCVRVAAIWFLQFVFPSRRSKRRCWLLRNEEKTSHLALTIRQFTASQFRLGYANRLSSCSRACVYVCFLFSSCLVNRSNYFPSPLPLSSPSPPLPANENIQLQFNFSLTLNWHLSSSSSSDAAVRVWLCVFRIQLIASPATTTSTTTNYVEVICIFLI